MKICCVVGGSIAEERGKRETKKMEKRRMLTLHYVVQSRCNAAQEVVSMES